MSKVEVNQVTQQCGTTLTVGGGACKTAVVDATTVTLGRCGGTVSLASGATQSGFGRTGTVDWVTTPKVTGDSPVTAASGSGYFLNTTAGQITINLPAGAAGSIVSLADYAGTWQTYVVTVAPNGTDKIGSVNASVILDTEGQSITLVYVDSTQGWINTMDSTSNVRAAAYIAATVSGACNTLVTAPDCANVKIATFTGPGTFCVSTVGGCVANNLVSYMVVAGAGGGGSWGGGGGGAGGYREVKGPLTPYTASPLDGYATPANHVTVTAQGYPIDVGAGGPAPPSYPTRQCGTNGSNSVFDTITSTGGGRGGNETNPAQPTTVGNSGGSAGGGRSTGGTGNTPPTTPAQGNNGGDGHANSPIGAYFGGGGGGAGAVGTGDPGGNDAGPGGAGVTTSISASPTAYAGGGGGGNVNTGCSTGGAGGGGAGGGGDSGTAGTAGGGNTGGGGGAAGASSPSGPSTAAAGAGGSGLVIIRYKFQ